MLRLSRLSRPSSQMHINLLERLIYLPVTFDFYLFLRLTNFFGDNLSVIELAWNWIKAQGLSRDQGNGLKSGFWLKHLPASWSRTKSAHSSRKTAGCGSYSGLANRALRRARPPISGRPGKKYEIIRFVDRSPFQLEITASIRERPLRAALASVSLYEAGFIYIRRSSVQMAATLRKVSYVFY